MDKDAFDNSSKETKEINSPGKTPEESQTGKRKFDDLGNLRFSRSQKKESTYDDLSTFIKGNTKDTIAYVLIVAGILMMFFDNVSIFGGLIVGVVLGLYFAKELSYLVMNASRLIEEEGLTKSLMLGALLLILLFKIPFVVIGAALVALLRTYFISEK